MLSDNTDIISEHLDAPVKHYSINSLEKTGLVRAIFTTRERSSWKYDKPGAYGNFEILSKMLGITLKDMVMSDQTHSDRIRIVTREDGGDMITGQKETSGFDGMITNIPGMMLCTVEADCVPVYILDPVGKAVGMVHSGWRGTAKHIAANAVKLMAEEYGSNPSDILIAIGPCICADCYEVGMELRKEFAVTFNEDSLDQIFVHPHADDKYMLDLKKAITITLMQAGVQKENIIDTGICTRESEELCSWRRDNPLRESMLTAIMLLS